MAQGMYTAPERVVRDGRLVCFKGEVMTAAEAVSRGLAAPKRAKRAPDRALADMTVKELEELAAKLGAECPKGATKAVLTAAIEGARA